MSSKPKKSFFKEGGVFFVFLTIISLFYFHGMYHKNLVYKELVLRKRSLEKQRDLASLETQELELLIKSYSDPKWLEMVLMKGLGMVPQGQLKVYFKKEE